LDEPDQKKTLKFNVVDSGTLNGNVYAQHRQNEYTKVIAHTLEEFKQGRGSLPSLPTLTLSPPGTGKKFVFGIGLFLGIVLATSSLMVASFFAWFFGAFLTCMSLAALGIDHIRIRTGWHPALKLAVYVALFLVAFVLFITAIALFEVLNII
jgi:hypothetical protein